MELELSLDYVSITFSILFYFNKASLQQILYRPSTKHQAPSIYYIFLDIKRTKFAHFDYVNKIMKIF